MVSDLRGVLPFFQHHIPSIVDARQRLLASGGVLIPCRDTLWATLVEDPELYRPYAEPWLRNDYVWTRAPGSRWWSTPGARLTLNQTRSWSNPNAGRPSTTPISLPERLR